LIKGNLRRLWEEEVPFNYNDITDPDEKKSIKKYCKNSGYKYFSHFVSGNNYEFKGSLIGGNAVSFEILLYKHIYKDTSH
jgi:hypothetical protein